VLIVLLRVERLQRRATMALRLLLAVCLLLVLQMQGTHAVEVCGHGRYVVVGMGGAALALQSDRCLCFLGA